MAQRSKALHSSVRGVTTDPGSFPGCGKGKCTIGPASSRLGEGLAGGAHCALVTPCGLQADPGCQLNSVSSDTLVLVGVKEHG